VTLSASRDGQKVTVHTTYGPITNEVIEDAQHVRHFHTMLGQMLDEAEAEAQDQRAIAD
jgi:hypothetical protein